MWLILKEIKGKAIYDHVKHDMRRVISLVTKDV
jgi:hypothetical protein